MAIASTPTLLPLDRFFRIAGIHPLHANQVTVADIAPLATCSDPLLQFSWQDADRTGREEIAQVIAEVETKLISYLNFSLKPTYYNKIDYVVPRFGAPNSDTLLYGRTVTMNSNLITQPYKLGAGYVIAGGQEKKSVLTLNSTITYSDEDMDGYKETATVVVPNVDADSNIVTSIQEVAIYYPEKLADDRWEIRPISGLVDLIGGTITAKFFREQAVSEPLLFGYNTSAVDGLVDANFLDKVDVYHHWLDVSAPQAQLTDSISGQSDTAVLLPQNQPLGWGILQPAHWDATLGAYVYDCAFSCGSPDTVQLFFKAGWPLDAYGNMDGLWERCITYLVLSMLDRPICACPSLAQVTTYWAYDTAQSNASVSNRISTRKLDNPLGTSRAALYAWEQILRYRNPD